MKNFMWIFDRTDFTIKDIIEITDDYEINIDEETNENSTVNILKDTGAKARDIVVIKRSNTNIFWGIITNISAENGELPYEFTIKYITNLFDQDIILQNEDLINSTGIEDFIADAITNNFINNEDTFVNISWLELNIVTHTKKSTSVSNVEDNIYNLHTWMTNCTQNYDIVYSFEIKDKKIIMTIENKEYDQELIDINALGVTDYTEVYETDVVSKVVVLTDTDTYTLYLLSDRTTTTDMTDENRADGKIETVYTAEYDDAEQKALDVMKSNSYNHNITFKLYDKYLKIGTPILIKTKSNNVLESYISSIKITESSFYEYICGNIRINFIEKILKEKNKNA